MYRNHDLRAISNFFVYVMTADWRSRLPLRFRPTRGLTPPTVYLGGPTPTVARQRHGWNRARGRVFFLPAQMPENLKFAIHFDGTPTIACCQIVLSLSFVDAFALNYKFFITFYFGRVIWKQIAGNLEGCCATVLLLFQDWAQVISVALQRFIFMLSHTVVGL